MQSLLAYALSFFGFVDQLITWAINHPDAAAFYVLLINTVIQKLPWRGADDGFSILARALKSAYVRRVAGRGAGAGR